MSEFTVHRYFPENENTGSIKQFEELNPGMLESFCVADFLAGSFSEDICSAESADQSKDSDKNDRKNGSERKKRRSEREEQDKKEEVVHVRARRGQATDNHSLAERVRREKINKKLKCLQDLVPGCQKTMGLVAMLDEIISYVHSLKNQVEFLSMELEAACSNP